MAVPLVTRVTIEQVPIDGIVDEARPRISWIVEGDPDPAFEARFAEIERTDSAGEVAVARVVSDGVLAAWPFDDLKSRDHGHIRVRVGSPGRWTDWSRPVPYRVGLQRREDWTAKLISRAGPGDTDGPAPFFFTRFDLTRRPVTARLYISAEGVYEARMNRTRVGEDVLAPGWTAYASRLRYQSYDVLDLLRIGRNEFDILVGNGWFRGQLAWPGNRSTYGDRVSVIAQLELQFEDGSRRVIATDETWRTAPSGILFNDLYDGETQDLRIPDRPLEELAEHVGIRDADTSRLVARRGAPVRITERVKAIALLTSPSGRQIVDFGQNLVGWVELTVRGAKPGQQVSVRHAEVLENGELAVRPLRSAKATCAYILAGEPVEVLRPRFTFSGFRYAEVTGVENLSVDDVTALVVGSDLERIGWFSCSDPMLNRLHENVVWSARGNFLDIPSDCPQRDERLGWSGDIQVFAPTANALFDTSGFLAGWLEDLAAEQRPDGGVPYVVPDVLGERDPAAAGWGDAAVIVPTALAASFGDDEVLRRQFTSMRRWVDKVAGRADADGIWRDCGPFGDWLDPSAPRDRPQQAKADLAVVGTAYFARSSRLLSWAAERIGEKDLAVRYAELADHVAKGFEREFVSPDGIVTSDCQTVYALALAGGLISDDTVRERAGKRLAELVVEADYRVATGFLGTPTILDALCLAGRCDLAYRMLLQTQPPSWLFPITLGATTIWERWDSMLPDGSINPDSMTSFNHYAYGAVADWMHRSIAGLRLLEPTYRRFEVRPIIGGGLTTASFRLRSPRGMIGVEWQVAADDVELRVQVPFGAQADVWVPGRAGPTTVGWGRHEFRGVLATEPVKEGAAAGG